MVNFPKPTGWFIVTWLFLWPLAVLTTDVGDAGGRGVVT
jgi:hypothetical protein